jgi:hypothetical protein
MIESAPQTIKATAVTPTEEKRPAHTLQAWVDELYGDNKPQNVVETLLADRRQEETRN